MRGGMRGGSFYHSARSCRSASPFRYLLGFQSWYGGFRPVAEMKEVVPEGDRMFRGGSFWYGSRLCRAASRLRYDPGIWTRDWGFRPVAEVRQ